MPWRQPQGIGVKIPEQNKLIISTSITILDTDNTEIGFITELSYSTTRRVERIRMLYATAAGRVVEQVPAPEDLTLTVNGFALYEQTLPGALTEGTENHAGKIFHALNTQYIPFNITIEETHPVTNDTVVVLFGDCWMTDFSHPMRLADVYITETATVQPSYVKTLEASDGTTELDTE